MSRKQHSYISVLQQQLAEGRIDRREFLRSATLLGLSAGAAYGFVGKLFGESAIAPARADTTLPKGGTIRIAQRVKDITSPHAINWLEAANIFRQVAEYLTKTGTDNITRPYLLESWEASDDLKTWTLHVRKGVKWHSGRAFTAEDVVWNFKHVLDESVGSSVIGLMTGYMLNTVKKSGKDVTEIWDANAIEKVDDYTVRLNCKAPQLAVPEHLFHYPFAILDPEQGGKFGVGSNGTGAFDLVEHVVGQKAVLKARSDYWGEGPHLDSLVFVDLGDTPSMLVAALAANQVEGMLASTPDMLPVLQKLDHCTMYKVDTSETDLVRVKVSEKPFDDPRVRKAMRLAVDAAKVQKISLGDLGTVGEHHHVSPIHPEYAKLPPMTRDVAAAKKLLADAGYPDGIDSTITFSAENNAQQKAVEAMVQQWQEAGIRVKINVVPGAQYWDIWEKVPMGCTNWSHRPLGVMLLALAYRSGVPWNESGYSNPEFDALLTKAEGILDPKKRSEVVAQLEKIMQEDGPLIQPAWHTNFTFYDQRVQGFKLHPTNYIFGEELAISA